jgi:hypothetical protein
MQRRFFVVIALFVVLGTLLTACGSAATSTQTACPTLKAQDFYGKAITRDRCRFGAG